MTATTQDWADFANCLGVDPDLFFPARGDRTEEAKAVCQGCSVRAECLEYALANSEKFGVWGAPPVRAAPPRREPAIWAPPPTPVTCDCGDGQCVLCRCMPEARR